MDLFIRLDNGRNFVSATNLDRPATFPKLFHSAWLSFQRAPNALRATRVPRQSSAATNFACLEARTPCDGLLESSCFLNVHLFPKASVLVRNTLAIRGFTPYDLYGMGKNFFSKCPKIALVKQKSSGLGIHM